MTTKDIIDAIYACFPGEARTYRWPKEMDCLTKADIEATGETKTACPPIKYL